MLSRGHWRAFLKILYCRRGGKGKPARELVEAVAAELAAFLARHGDLELPDGGQRVVRRGHDPARPIQTGIGPVEASKPTARDGGARADERIRYSSSILPKWARRTKSLDVLVPAL